MARRCKDVGSVHAVCGVLQTLGLFTCLLLSACAQSDPKDEPALAHTQAALSIDKQSALFQLPAGATPLRLVVKFNEGSAVRLRNGRLVTLGQGALPASAGARDSQGLTGELDRVQTELGRRGLQLARLFSAASDEQLADLKQRGEARARRSLSDLGLYHHIPATAFRSTAEMEEARAYLAALAIVELAYIEAEPPPPPDANTPDYRPQQRYKGPAPIGIDADFAATLPGGKGAGVRVVDVENLLVQAHEDLPPLAYSRGVAYGASSDQQHVVAATGIITGLDNGYGVTGIAPQAALGSSGSSSQSGYNIPEAIIAPIASGFLRQGDVLLLELQRSGPTVANCRCGGAGCVAYVPEEFLAASFDAIATATANGVVVVEAAGNGYVNLDDPIYQGAFDRARRDSGALMVGARYSTVEQPTCFSNAGRRVDVHAWGENVATTGYGYAYQGTLGVSDMYTQSFGGTSSASAITAGVVASLQGFARAAFGVPLSPAEVRAVLSETGTPQVGEAASPIGVQPNLRAAIARLRGQPAPTQTSFVADFESGIEHFTVATTGVDLPWTRYSGATPTASTGPSGDRTSGSGYYMYIESSGSGAGYPNKTAMLESACLDLRSASLATWTFYYHMVGVEMGRLVAEADVGCDGGTPVKLFEQIGARTGTERNGFVRQTLDLSQLLGSTVRLRLRGITGAGPRSDIAVDDLSVSITRSGECTSNAQCAAPETCVNQRCVSCQSDAECASGYCADGSCGECRLDMDCSDDGVFCTEEICTDGNVCSRRARSCGGRVCSNELRRCVECRTSADCPSGRSCDPQNNCVVTAPCQQFASTTQQHLNASRAYTARVESRVEARVNGSNELLESRSLFGRFSTTLRTVRNRATLDGYELGTCPR